MMSSLEKALVNREAKSVPIVLFRYLDDGQALRSVRATSTVLYHLVDRHPRRLFRQLYLQVPLQEGKSIGTLEVIAPLCHDLTVKVGGLVLSQADQVPSTTSKLQEPSRKPSLWSRRKILPGLSKRRPSQLRKQTTVDTCGTTRASTPPIQLSVTDRKEQTETRQFWETLLSRFRQLQSLTFKIIGKTAWSGRSTTEDILVTLRIAVETAGLPQLHRFNLHPIHPMGIIHLRWDGFEAFSEASATAANMWMRIDALELRIHSPFAGDGTTATQQTMFKKILYSYLHSFAPSLRFLSLVWLGGEGPSPVALHQEPGLEGRSPIHWPKLEELYVGNISLPNQTIQLVGEHARLGTRIKLLRSTRRDSAVACSDSSAWIEILGPYSTPVRSQRSPETASSVYSQDEQSIESTWPEGISRSSQEMLFMLDL
jgi:hypothetical protein